MFMMQNIVACILFLLVAELSLSEPIVDRRENEKRPKVNLGVNSVYRVTSGNTRGVESKINEDVLEETFQNCEKDVNNRKNLEIKLAETGRVIKVDQRKADPSLQRMRKFDPLARALESAHVIFDEASNRLCKRFNLSRDEVNQDLPNVPLTGKLPKKHSDTCRQITATTSCNAKSRYRTADGQCNNIWNPSWGSAMSCQQRLLQAYYEDNSGFRRSVFGEPLPAPRNLSLNLHYHLNRPTENVTHMYMFFGQLLDHDITLTPFSTTVDNQAIQCCPPENETHPQCAPILVSADDPFYSEFGTTCLNFVRSVICPTCTMGPREQMNQVTAYIDGSFVYGNSNNQTNSLRANDGTGMMRVERGEDGHDLLPSSPNPEGDQCSFPDTNDICFEAGDPRANQHTVLTSLHTVFVREHNRLARELRRINPHWDGERLFQEARRILGAEMQVITYKEYLPITLGRDRMTYFQLWIGRNTVYNSSEDATMMNEFTTAAFRFGHSMINSVVADYPLNDTNGRRLLRNEFFQPFELRRGVAGSLLGGASDSPAQWFNRHLVPDVRNFLFRIRGNPTGLDLAAANINRGRDHGAPPYVEMVKFCSEGRIVVRTFDDLVIRGLMTTENAEALQQNYSSVRDIDLWPGILMEIPNDRAVVGPTAVCVIGVQFHKLKFGDRFYFEHRCEAGSFTWRQLQELRNVSLSQIMCMNSNVQELPENAMLPRSRDNSIINCDDVRGPDLYYWKE